MVGGAGKLQVLGATMFPLPLDRVAQHVSGTLIDYETPADDVDGNLYAPQRNDGRIEGRQRGRRFSAFTAARLHPVAALGTLAALGAVGAWAATRDTAGLAKA